MSYPSEEKPYEKLKELENSLENAKNSGNISKIFDFSLELGNLCYKIKANELGLKYVQEAIEFSKENNTSQNLHKFYDLLGDFNFELGLLDEANEAYNSVIKNTPKNNYLKLLAEVYFKLGRIYYIQEKGKQAINHFKKAEKICEGARLYTELAKTYNQIGLMYLNKIPRSEAFTVDRYYWKGSSSFGKAKKYFEKAKIVIEENNLVEKENTLYNSIQASLATKFGDFK
ncbi:MAG: tetratricopeptide repeat protein [Promethearchaeota archaeon]